MKSSVVYTSWDNADKLPVQEKEVIEKLPGFYTSSAREINSKKGEWAEDHSYLEGFLRVPFSFHKTVTKRPLAIFPDDGGFRDYIEVKEIDQHCFVARVSSNKDFSGYVWWLFYFHDNIDESHEIMPLPEGVSIGEYGTLSITYSGEKLVFKCLEGLWPWPIVDSEKSLALGKINFLLEPADDNPLTIILQSPNPYKGLGKQLVRKMTDIRDVLSRTKV